MAQADTNHLLYYDEVSALLLSNIDEGWLLDLSPWDSPAPGTAISPRNKANRSKKPRQYPRLEILNTRRELIELELELQILMEKHEFCESVEAAKSRCGLNWRLFASREQILLKRSVRMNSRLLKRVNGNSRLIDRIYRLIQRQPKELTTKSVQISCQIVSLTNEPIVRRTMQACLDIRIKHQLDSILKQCEGGMGRTSQATEWSSFTFGDRRVGVGFQEAVVLPFVASFISSSIGDWPSIDSIQLHTKGRSAVRQDEFAPDQQTRGQATELGRRLILQRLVQVRGRTLVLWEDAFCYESYTSTTSSVKGTVRGSGWAVISPVEGHIDDLSVVHSGGFIQIHSTDQSNLQTSDQLSTDIVSYSQALHRSRMTRLEEILISNM